MAGRRLLLLLVFLTAVGLPAGVLSAACAGRSCAGSDDGPAHDPFCPLPGGIRTAIENGYHEDRSPDVMVVTGQDGTLAGPQAVTSGRIAWPSAGDAAARVPLLFTGAGLDADAEIPDGTTLDRIAPTVAEAIGLRRPFPDVRSGTAIPGVASGSTPHLVVIVTWAGVGSATLEAHPNEWPSLRRLVRDDPATLEADPASLPLDPAAVLATIGTGGLPSQHGMTGSVVRNDHGDATVAFGPGADYTVIATLAEDLDEQNDDEAFIGLVAPRTEYRGLIGGEWYRDRGEPDDDVVVDASGAGLLRGTERMIDDLAGSIAGRDEVTDLIGVVLEGDLDSLDRWTARIIAAADRAAHGRALIVVTGTGDAADATATDGDRVIVQAAAGVPGGTALIEDVVPGGVFLDQDVLAREGATGQSVVDALLAERADDGRPVFRDAFQGFAVSFARYC